MPRLQPSLEPREIARGYEYEKGRFVILTDEEVEAVPGSDAHKVEILDFVKLKTWILCSSRKALLGTQGRR